MKHVGHSDWACALELVPHNKGKHSNKEPVHRHEEEACTQQRSPSAAQNKQERKNKLFMYDL